MRVTGNMLSANLLNNLYGNMKNLNRYQNQLAADKKILRLSDDPIGSINSIQIATDIKKAKQMGRNISDAEAWLTQTETALLDINSILIRAKELAVDAGNGTYTAEQRVAIKEELVQLQNQFIELANSKFSGKYIFGGYNTTSKPFTVNADGSLSYNSIADLNHATLEEIDGEKAQIRKYKVSATSEFEVSVSGVQVAGTGSDNIYSIFRGLINCIENDELTDEIASYSDKFSGSQEKILTLVSDIGGRQKGLELITERYESESLNLHDRYAKIAGIDRAEVITQYKMAENTYNAALQVGAKIIQNSLVDFLR